MPITITLDGPAARDTIRNLARGYATAKIELALPPRCANAPWLWGRINRAKWEKPVMARKLAYRAALLSILDDLPDAPFPELRKCELPDGRRRPVYYSEKTRVLASQFADEVLALAGLADG